MSSNRGYDRLAKWYQTLEWLRFGGALQRGRSRLIDHLPPSKSSLFLGEGDGRLLKEFALRYPTTKITSVDFSHNMLELQQRRLGHRSSGHRRLGHRSLGHCPLVNWIHQDVRKLNIEPSSFDLIVAPFFLDCFDHGELQTLSGAIADWLCPNGTLYVVDFCIPDSGIRKYWARFWLWVMHKFFHWQTGLKNKSLIDAGPILARHGFHLVLAHRPRGTMIYAAIYQKR